MGIERKGEGNEQMFFLKMRQREVTRAPDLLTATLYRRQGQLQGERKEKRIIIKKFIKGIDKDY